MNDLQLIKKFKNEVEIDIDKLLKKISINQLIKFILVTMEDLFNHEYFIFSREIIAEEFSYLLYKKLENNKNKINLFKIINEDYTKFLENNKNLFSDLTSLFMVRNTIRNMEIYIEKQGYIIENKNSTIKIKHPIKELQHYDMLGYLRNSLEGSNIGFESISKKKLSLSDILDIATKYETMNAIKYEIRSSNTEKELIIFQFDPVYLANLTRIITNSHDAKFNQVMSKYFDNSQIELTDKCTKKGNIRWIDLFHVSLVLDYISLYISKIIKEKATSYRMANNSKLLLMTNKQLENFFLDIFTELNNDININDVKNFIGRFTINILSDTKRIDLQFTPIIKVEERSFVLFNTFSLTDIMRAYINNNNLALDDQGQKFENEVYKRLKIGFPENKIFTSIKYNDYYEKKGEIDICLIGKKSIFFIECKNSLLSISASSATNNYEYIFKAKSQLEQVERCFNTDRNKFLKKYCNLNISGIEEYSLYKIIILSNKNISGLNFSNIAVRDIYSLDRLIINGVINTLSINEKNEIEVIDSISLYENKINFQERDFINYINNDFIFFDKLNKLAQKKINHNKYKDYTFESFNYFVDMRI
ncbi:NERD domain-containing protein [Arcobacter lacus]|uniref:NERD domain-containing protein n=1 Tax=Arcobacter lacus TaxID=1912876 RepID=UPI0021BA9ACC|nr:NERD domain-containing protein [Arcobacter lacus]MCT7910524.1 NERD domain-containing protein [Arcobacter lacus]